jgi:type IV pilus assembly protein PilO
MRDLNLNELTFDTIASWPALYKGISVFVLAILVFVGAYFFSFKLQLEDWQRLKDKEIELRGQLEMKQQQAANLPLYRRQLSEMKERFGELLRQLPSKTEVPNLLEDISQTGVQSGLKFLLFDPLHEVEHDFYVELPIKIKVTGNYHQLANFISRVASLGRIVTLHDFSIVIPEDKSLAKAKEPVIDEGDKKLIMNITAKIYRYQGFSSV